MLLTRGRVVRTELIALARRVKVLGVKVLGAVGGEGELVAVGDAEVREVARAGVLEDAWRMSKCGGGGREKGKDVPVICHWA